MLKMCDNYVIMAKAVLEHRHEIERLEKSLNKLQIEIANLKRKQAKK